MLQKGIILLAIHNHHLAIQVFQVQSVPYLLEVINCNPILILISIISKPILLWPCAFDR